MTPLPSHRNRNRRVPLADINVTPMVDVMLVLLIIFMVTAPLLVAGVPVNLPESRAKSLDQGEEALQLSIDENGGLFIDETATTIAALPLQLAQIDKTRQIYLRADTRLDYGTVMQVMGELNRAGLNKVSLVTTGTTSANDPDVKAP